MIRSLDIVKTLQEKGENILKEEETEIVANLERLSRNERRDLLKQPKHTQTLKDLFSITQELVKAAINSVENYTLKKYEQTTKTFSLHIKKQEKILEKVSWLLSGVSLEIFKTEKQLETLKRNNQPPTTNN